MSRFESIYLGESPADEPCQQVGTDTYDPLMAKAECRALINQIRRICGDEPDGARLKIKSNSHDFGTYQSVEVYYDPNNEQATEYAFLCEEKYPENWDAKAIRELHQAVINRPDGNGCNGSALPGMTIGDVLRDKHRRDWNSIDTSHD